MTNEQLQPLTEMEIEGFEAIWRWSKDEPDIDNLLDCRNALGRLLADWRRMEAEIGAWENRYGEFGKKHITAQLAGQIVAAKLDGARAVLEAAAREFSPDDYIQTGEHPAATIRALVDDDEWLAALLEDK